MANFNWFLNRQGIQGRKGEKGDTGFSPTISVGTDTLDEYKLIIANESNSFETPNLRGNINIQDNGGTYLRYDAEAQQISAQSMDAATADTVGGVRLSTEADIVEMGAGSVVTPSDVADALPLYLEGEGAVTITQDELTSKTKIKVDVPSVNDLESRMSTAEAEIADIQTDVANLNNDKVSKTDLATTESAGIVKVDGTTIFSAADGTISAISGGALPIASTTQLGGVKVDGTSIIADENGVISSTGGGGGTGDVPIATTETAGKVKPDGTTITVTGDGTISAVPTVPTNMVTTDTEQTITANKTFSTSSVVTFGAGLAQTSIKNDVITIGGTDKDLVFSSGSVPNGESGTLQAGRIKSNTGIINIVPDWSNQSSGDGIVLSKNSLLFNNNEVLTKADIATDTTAGIVKVDGTSVTIDSNGVISATGGGGSAPDNMVTTDSDQTINGSKTFANGTGTTFTGTSSNSNSLTIDGDDKEIRFNSANQSDAVIKNQGWDSANLNIGTNFNSVKITTTLYDKNGNEIVGGSASGDVPIATTETAGKVKPDGTTITVTEDGTISAVPTTPSNMVTTDTSQIITGDKTFTNSITFNNTLNMSTGGTDTLNIYATGTYAQGYTTDIDVRKNLNIKTRLSGGAITLAPSGSGLNGLKYKDSSNTSNPSYDILHTGNLVTGNNITISEPNSTGVRTISGPSNEYMAHMAMPSNRYVDLTLGASGTTYTAPADGYIIFRNNVTATGQQIQLQNTANGIQTWIHSSKNNGIIGCWISVSKGNGVSLVYDMPSDGANRVFRFVYAKGSESEAS